MKNSADSETQRMMKKWQEEKLARFEKDAVGRLLAIAGLVIVMIAAYFYKGSGGIDTVVAVFGFALLLIGRIIMSRAAYEPSQRTQDALETGTSVIEKIRHWF